MDDRGFDVLTRRVFAVTSRRSLVAGLASVLPVLIGLVTGPEVAAQRSQRRGKRCRAVGQRCASGQRPGCCGKAICRRGRCRCGKHQKPCRGHCINTKRRCTCPGQQQKCGKRCVNLKTAKAHCGACGNACAGTAVCKQGACVAGAAYREVRRWGGEVDGHVLAPVGIAMSRAGLLYVTDFQPTSGRIWVFSANGGFIESWPLAVRNPVGIDITPSGRIYVSHNVSDGTIETFSLDGTPGITFAADGPPVGLAVGRNDDVYVAITNLNQIQRFAADGTLIETWGGAGYNLTAPFWVATAANGDVYLTELLADERQVKRFSATGAIKASWDIQGTFPFLGGVTVDAAGFVYVVDLGTDRVLKFTANGSLVGTFGESAGLTEPADVVVSPNGMVYVTDSQARAIIQFAPA